MRRLFSIAILTFTGLTGVACTDERAVNVTGIPDAEVAALLSSNAEIAELRRRSDALLTGRARAQAQFALARLQADIAGKRSTIHESSLGFASIALLERRMNRIPEDRIGHLIEVLCKLQQMVKPHLHPAIATIPWCEIDPQELEDEAAFELVSNSDGGTISSPTEQITLTVESNTMQDAAGNTVEAAFFSIFPLDRLPATATDAHPCPTPWDPTYAANDCFEEFYELSVQPPVQFVGIPAHLEICQLHPGSSPDAPPTQAVADRLRLFSKAGDNSVSVLEQSERGATGTGACDGDPDLHPTAIGPVDFTKNGIKNAWLNVAHLGSRAMKSLGPKVLHAANVPTHGDIFGELLGLGNVVGSLDLVIQATQGVVTPSSATIFVGGTIGLSAAFADKTGVGVGERGATWTSSNPAVATVNNDGVVTGVSAGTVAITATSDRAVASAAITVDDNASFLGIWNGSITSGITQPVTILVTSQSGSSAAGDFRIALPGETVSYVDGVHRFFTNGQVDGATLQFSVGDDSHLGVFVLTRSGDALTGTATEHFSGGGTRVWTANLTLGTVAAISPPPMLGLTANLTAGASSATEAPVLTGIWKQP